MARTMTDEQERDIFAACDNDWTYTEQTYRKWCQSLKAELDAERDAHEATKATLAQLVELARRHKREADLIETGEFNWERSLPDALALEAMLLKLISA